MIDPTFYAVVEESHMIYGLISNCLLMYAILRFTRKSLGVYKHLQLIFAVFDFFLVLQHMVLKPRVMVVNKTVFGVATDWNNRYITAFYCCCNTVPFVLMCIDFVYRYWSIAHPHLISLFRTPWFIAVITIVPIVEFSIWYLVATEVMIGPEYARALLAEESGRRLGKEMTDGWLILNHWENDELNIRALFALMVFDVVMAICFSIALTLGILTYYHIYYLSSISTHSAHALSMQRKLFISVCFQTLIPFVFVYMPYATVLNLPFVKWNSYFWDDGCMLLASCFPAWDAMIVIVLMPDYWKGVVGTFRPKKKNQTSVESISVPSRPTVTSQTRN